VISDYFLNKIDRRTFLQIISFTGISGLIYPRSVLSSLIPNALSRVVVIEDNMATSGNEINSDTVQIMMDSGIKSMAQEEQIGNAWRTLLPNISPDNTVAIKVNCINSSLSTHPEVTQAVVQGLKQMSFDGTFFPDINIIIYDRTNGELTRAGYTLNTSDSGVRCFGTNASGIGYDTTTFDVYGSSQRLSKIISQISNYLINISVLKNHGTSGVTLCLKNHYGTCNSPGSLHGNYGDPYIPALNALEPIQSKQMVNICDALYGIKSGGPSGSPQFIANKIIISKDIVALDSLGRQILVDNGCTTIARATHIDTACTEYGLGTNDPEQMDIVNIINPTSGIKPIDHKVNNPKEYVLRQNYPNPFNNHTQIRFYLGTAGTVELMIYSDTGRRIRTLISRPLNSGWHQVTWDGRNDWNKQVSSGLYICQLRTVKQKRAIIMHLIK